MRRSAAERHLSALDPRWAKLIADTGPCRIPPDAEEPWQALARSVVYQQLHGKAAAAIHGRMLALFSDGMTPDALAAAAPEALRGCGLSAAKAKAVQGIARAAAAGALPSRRAAARMDDEALIARLIPLPGIGRWTIEMFLIFTLARPDVWPVDDFGVRLGWQYLFGLPEMPSPKALRAEGAPLAPYRSTAAWYLWRSVDRHRAAQRAAGSP